MTSKKAKKTKKVSVTKPVKKVDSKESKKSVKKTDIKKVVKKIDEIDEEEIEIDEISTEKGKVKKTLEIDAADILPEVEEKVLEEESPLLGLEDEDSEDALGLDSEEINPFGDKWEM